MGYLFASHSMLAHRRQHRHRTSNVAAHRFIYRNERIHAFEKQKIKENARVIHIGRKQQPGRAGPGHIDDATWNIHRHQQIHVTRIAPLRVFNVRFQTIALRADEFNSVFSPVVVVVVSSLLMRKCYSALCALMPCCRWCSACVQFHVHYSHLRWQHVKLHIIILLFSSLSPFLLSFHRLAAFSVLFSFRRRTHSNEHNGFLCSIMSRCVRVFYYRIFRVNRCSTKSASTEWYWESVLRQRRRRRRKKQIDAVNNTSTELYGKCGAHQTQC